MTLGKDQDPGWWRREMSKRGLIIIGTIAGGVLVAALVAIAVLGIPLF